MPNTKFINQNPRTVRVTKQSKIIKFAQKSFESFKKAVEKKMDQHLENKKNKLEEQYNYAYDDVQQLATQMKEGKIKRYDYLQDYVYDLSQIGVKLVDLELKRRLRVEKRTKAFKLNSSTLGKISSAFKNNALLQSKKIIEKDNTKQRYQESADKLYSAVTSNRANIDLELDRLRNYDNYSPVFSANMSKQQPDLEKTSEPVVTETPSFSQDIFSFSPEAKALEKTVAQETPKSSSIFAGAASRPVSQPEFSAMPEVKAEEPVISAEAPKPSPIFEGAASRAVSQPEFSAMPEVKAEEPVISAEAPKPVYQENSPSVIDAVNLTPFATKTVEEASLNAEKEGMEAGQQAADDMLKVIEEIRKSYQPQSNSTEVQNSSDVIYNLDVDGEKQTLVSETTPPIVTPEVKDEEPVITAEEPGPSPISEEVASEPVLQPELSTTPEVKAPLAQETLEVPSESVTVSTYIPLKKENNDQFNTMLSSIESMITNLNKQKEDNNNRQLQIQSEIATLNEQYQKVNTENAQISANLTELNERLKVANLMAQGFGVDEILTQVPQSERLKYVRIAGELEGQRWKSENTQSRKM